MISVYLLLDSSNGGCHLRIQIKKYGFKVAVSR